MNVVDSCGWLEYFADGPNATFFTAAIEDTAQLIVPAVCVFEVYKRLHAQHGKAGADQGIAFLSQGKQVDLSFEELAAAAVAARLHGLAMADAMIWQTAQLHAAQLYTQDADLQGLPGVRYVAKLPTK